MKGKSLDSLFPQLFDFDSMPSRVKVGETWILGPHKLYCGNSEDNKAVDDLLGGEKVALCFTDPPYNIGTQSYGSMKIDTRSGSIRSEENFRRMEKAELTKFNPSKFLEILETLFSDDHHASLIFPGWNLLNRYSLWAEERKLSVNHLVWCKDQPIPFGGHPYDDTEPLIYVRKNAKWNTKRNEVGRSTPLNRSSWLRYSRDTIMDAPHPTVKPLTLCMNMIELTTLPGELVYDPYVGSGTNIYACQLTGRRCVAAEISPEFCSFILMKYEQLFGIKPFREDEEHYGYEGIKPQALVDWTKKAGLIIN